VLIDRLREQRLEVIPRSDGAWDVAVIIDGGYADFNDAIAALPHWLECLAKVEA
jgi:hypothetical protein